MRDGRRHIRWLVLLSVVFALTAGLAWLSWAPQPPLVTEASAFAAQERGRSGAQQEGVRHTLSITAKRYQFSPDRIEVRENDLVKITFSTEDIPHSFVIDEYRIAKRATPGHPVTFEFRADQAGTFQFQCNLTADEGCRRMHGELVVRPR